jgi:hypothetical protein
MKAMFSMPRNALIFSAGENLRRTANSGIRRFVCDAPSPAKLPWSEPHVVAVARSYEEFLEGLKRRRADLRLTLALTGEIAGLQNGYAEKILAPTPLRHLGRVSFTALIGALGLAVVLVEDPEQMARVKNRHTPRLRPPQRTGRRRRPALLPLA